jgi:hypothetical protein
MKMESQESWEKIAAGLAGLQVYEADALRIERIRARCMAALAKQQRRECLFFKRFSRAWQWLEPAVAGSLSALYLVTAFISSLALLR